VRSRLPFAPEGVTLSEADRAALFYEFLMRFTGVSADAHTTPDGAGTGEPTLSHSDRIREEIKKKISRSSVKEWHAQEFNA
jgi:hypothetical protein